MIDKEALVEKACEYIDFKEVRDKWFSSSNEKLRKKCSVAVTKKIFDSLGQSWDYIESFRKELGMAGLELKLRGFENGEADGAKNVIGVHLSDWSSWMPVYLCEPERLTSGCFKDIDEVKKHFGMPKLKRKKGMKNILIKRLAGELDFAAEKNAAYAVMHAMYCDYRHTLTGNPVYEDSKVVFAAMELLRESLHTSKHKFNGFVLYENGAVYESGFKALGSPPQESLTDGYIIEMLKETEGICLDTGHLLSHNLDLTEGDEFIQSQTEIFKDRIMAVHLSDRIKIPGQLPHGSEELQDDFNKAEGYYAKKAVAAKVIGDIDQHLPIGFTIKKPHTFLKTIYPLRIVFELKTDNLSEAYFLQQARLLGL